MSKQERPSITPEYLESCGPPTLCSPAPGIIALISGDGYEAVDMTVEQARELRDTLIERLV